MYLAANTFLFLMRFLVLKGDEGFEEKTKQIQGGTAILAEGASLVCDNHTVVSYDNGV